MTCYLYPKKPSLAVREIEKKTAAGFRKNGPTYIPNLAPHSMNKHMEHYQRYNLFLYSKQRWNIMCESKDHRNIMHMSYNL